MQAKTFLILSPIIFLLLFYRYFSPFHRTLLLASLASSLALIGSFLYQFISVSGVSTTLFNSGSFFARLDKWNSYFDFINEYPMRIFFGIPHEVLGAPDSDPLFFLSIYGIVALCLFYIHC